MTAGDGTTTVVVSDGDAELASWPLDLHGAPNLAIINELARLQLAAGRAGWTVRLRGAPPSLWALLELTGLCDVIKPADEGGADGPPRR
jgi:hypothetical protein